VAVCKTALSQFESDLLVQFLDRTLLFAPVKQADLGG
jgi:hypothetical protein